MPPAPAPRALSPRARLLAQARRLNHRAAAMAGLQPAQPARPDPTIARRADSPTWAAAMARPASEGAIAAAHDAAIRANRPGGAARTAARYSDDTPPLGGWKTNGWLR